MSLEACAHISGMPAWVFWRILRDHLGPELDEVERLMPRGLPAGSRREILEAFRDLEAAGKAYLEDQQAQQALHDRRVSQARNVDDSGCETPAPSGRDENDEPLTTPQVADLLGISTRRAQQLAQDGLGTKLGDAPNAPWIFDRELVQAHARGQELT